MNCPKCGQRNTNKNALFCGFCGAKIDTTISPSSYSTIGSSRGRRFAVFGVVAVVLILISVGVLYWFTPIFQIPPDETDVVEAFDSAIDIMTDDSGNSVVAPSFIKRLDENIDYEVLSTFEENDQYYAVLRVSGLDMREAFDAYWTQNGDLIISDKTQMDAIFDEIALNSPVVQTEVQVPLIYKRGNYQIEVTDELIDAMYGKLYFKLAGTVSDTDVN